MRLRSELKMPLSELARVVGVHPSFVIGWSKHYSVEGSSTLSFGMLFHFCLF